MVLLDKCTTTLIGLIAQTAISSLVDSSSWNVSTSLFSPTGCLVILGNS